MILRKKIIKLVEGISNRGSLGEMIAELKKQGYQLMFSKEATCLYCIELNRWITADSFTVEEYYHFEDAANPDRDRMVYAISTEEGLKGYLVEATFVYEDNISPEMAQKLRWGYAQPGEV